MSSVEIYISRHGTETHAKKVSGSIKARTGSARVLDSGILVVELVNTEIAGAAAFDSKCIPPRYLQDIKSTVSVNGWRVHTFRVAFSQSPAAWLCRHACVLPVVWLQRNKIDVGSEPSAQMKFRGI